MALSKFKHNAESVYSITHEFENAQIVAAISAATRALGPAKRLVITDGTAGVGGDVFGFSKAFKYVNAVEIREQTFGLLVENCGGLPNASLVNADYSLVYNRFFNDVVYLDPPWGGPGYKRLASVKLFVGKLPLRTMIRRLEGLCGCAAIKVPKNCDISGIPVTRVHEILNPHGRVSFLLILVVFKKPYRRPLRVTSDA